MRTINITNTYNAFLVSLVARCYAYFGVMTRVFTEASAFIIWQVHELLKNVLNILRGDKTTISSYCFYTAHQPSI